MLDIEQRAAVESIKKQFGLSDATSEWYGVAAAASYRHLCLLDLERQNDVLQDLARDSINDFLLTGICACAQLPCNNKLEWFIDAANSRKTASGYISFNHRLDIQ